MTSKKKKKKEERRKAKNQQQGHAGYGETETSRSAKKEMSRQKYTPVVMFATKAYAKASLWAKLAGAKHREMTCFGHCVRREDGKFFVSDVYMVKHSGSTGEVDCKDEDVIALSERLENEGVDLANAFRCWIHSHPGVGEGATYLSGRDEEMISGFLNGNWLASVVFDSIGGSPYSRIDTKEPRLRIDACVEVGSPLSNEEVAALTKEYDENSSAIIKTPPAGFITHKYEGHYTRHSPYSSEDDRDFDRQFSGASPGRYAGRSSYVYDKDAGNIKNKKEKEKEKEVESQMAVRHGHSPYAESLLGPSAKDVLAVKRRDTFFDRYDVPSQADVRLMMRRMTPRESEEVLDSIINSNDVDKVIRYWEVFNIELEDSKYEHAHKFLQELNELLGDEFHTAGDGFVHYDFKDVDEDNAVFHGAGDLEDFPSDAEHSRQYNLYSDKGRDESNEKDKIKKEWLRDLYNLGSIIATNPDNAKANIAGLRMKYIRYYSESSIDAAIEGLTGIGGASSRK